MNELFSAGLLDHVLDPVIATDPSFTVQSWNRAAETIYGWRTHEVLGKYLPDILPTEYVYSTREEVAAAFQRDGQWCGEVRQQTKTGDWLPILASVVILTGPDGKDVGVVSVNRAIQTIKQVQLELEQRVHERTAQLEAAVAELEAFSYSVSHDLRAPLRAINGFARILQKDIDLPEEANAFLGRIVDGARAMGELIDGLLAFSRLNQVPIERVAVSPEQIAAKALRGLGKSQDSQPSVVIDAMPSCCADPRLLEQVYSNLLGNALKFTRGVENATIHVGALQEEELRYFVTDNGAGFDMTYADKLFGVFQRLHTKEAFEGTGVGLAIVKRIVARHGGRVWAWGEEGRGASFYFTLPNSSPRKELL